MNNGQMDRGNENPTQHLPWWLRKTTKKPVRFVGTGIWTRDLPNASLVRYHGATTLGTDFLCNSYNIINPYNFLYHSSSYFTEQYILLNAWYVKYRT